MHIFTFSEKPGPCASLLFQNIFFLPPATQGTPEHHTFIPWWRVTQIKLLFQPPLPPAFCCDELYRDSNLVAKKRKSYTEKASGEILP